MRPGRRCGGGLELPLSDGLFSSVRAHTASRDDGGQPPPCFVGLRPWTGLDRRRAGRGRGNM